MGKIVSEVLLSKHPCPSQPPEKTLPEYDELLALIDLDVTTLHIEQVATQMQGAAGPGGLDSVAWQNWLLQISYASFKLWGSVAKLTRWMANTCLPWVAYQAIIAGRLIALEKIPGMRLDE
eukprot:9694681-Ditylum_brightwellii.AAC.1